MDFKRVAAATLTIVFTFAISPSSAFASEKTDVVAAVHRYLDNLDKDKDKLETALAMCDSNVSILDEFPPHEWHGPTACADWWKALLAYNEKSGITDGDATLGTPWTVDVSGDRAYFVAPMTYTYKQNGKPVKESAAFAVALKRTQAGWRITAWSYSNRLRKNDGTT
jgi:SnoaL-like domain